jgi:NADPH2:quinone reductase
VKALTNGRGADVVFDPVGGDVFDESMRCVNWDARLLTIGLRAAVGASCINLILIKH